MDFILSANKEKVILEKLWNHGVQIGYVILFPL